MRDQDDIAVRQPLELDATVAAHHQLLVLLFTLLGRDEHSRDVISNAISQRLSFHDAHEDAGVEADAAFAFERHVDKEFQRILGDAASALRAMDTEPGLGR